MASGVLIEDNMPGSVVVFLTVFRDAVRADMEQYCQRVALGWFRDEVSAIAAACERVMMRSAILPELRQLPPLMVQCERRPSKSGQAPDKFHRGTVVRVGSLGRRVVMLPGAHDKFWLRV